MSQFLPDNVSLTEGRSEGVRKIVNDMLRKPMGLPETFWSYATDWIGTNLPEIPYSGVVGGPEISYNVDNASTTRAATAYSGTSPTLTGLPNGVYMVGIGCLMTVGAATGGGYMGVQVDSTEATDAESVQVQDVTASISVSRWFATTLTSTGNHTLTARYRSNDTNTVTFENRWLMVIRISNP